MGENLSDYVSETGYYHRLTDEERHCAERVADIIDRFGSFEVRHDEPDVFRLVSAEDVGWCGLTLLFVEGRAPHFDVRLHGREHLEEVKGLLCESPAIEVLCTYLTGPLYFDLWAERVVLEHLPDLVEKILSLG